MCELINDQKTNKDSIIKRVINLIGQNYTFGLSVYL